MPTKPNSLLFKNKKDLVSEFRNNILKKYEFEIDLLEKLLELVDINNIELRESFTSFEGNYFTIKINYDYNSPVIITNSNMDYIVWKKHRSVDHVINAFKKIVL